MVQKGIRLGRTSGSEPSRNEEACTTPRSNLVRIDSKAVCNDLLRLLKAHGEHYFCRLVDLSLQVRGLEDKTSRELESLGKPPSDDSIGEINALIEQLVTGIKVGIEQRGRDEGKLLYLIEDEAIAMKKKLRGTCPDFRAWREGTKEPEPFIPIPDILLEEGDPPADKGTRKIIYLDSIIKQKTR